MTKRSTSKAKITNNSSSSKINGPRSSPFNSPTQSWIVSLQVPTSPLYVGSYVRVPVSIQAGSSITFDDLDFYIPAGPPGGQISLSKDVTFNPSLPEVMLLVGYRPGVYTLRCTNLNTGMAVGEARFTISDLWPDDLNGPNLWFNGILPGYSFGATWGGGDSNQPQNMNTKPALGTRRVAVLFVDTTDQRYSTDATTFGDFVNRWDQNLLTGVVEEGIPPALISYSAAQFYQEVSFENLKIEGQVFNQVVNLPGTWTDYFEVKGQDSRGNDRWAAKGEFCKQCVIAAGATIDLTGFNMIVCVSQSVAGTGGVANRIAWPWGGMDIKVQTPFGMVTSGGVSMPNEWGDGSVFDLGSHIGKNAYETLAHELGHTLGLNDEYYPKVDGRNLESWDMMDYEGTLPHFSLPFRMRLGWIDDPKWIKRYNFLYAGTLVDEPVNLSPVEKGAPPDDQHFIGIEVRIGDGHNYYFEYRRGQVSQIGDRQLLRNGSVLGVDIIPTPNSSRPEGLLLPKHDDDNGGVLGVGQFYHEVDNTTPTYPADFNVKVNHSDANHAELQIKYGITGKPDPSIRPWPRDDQHPWQSPDIEVSNARSQANPAKWANVPWLGHNNTVTAKIKNGGTINALGVVAKFYYKDLTISNAPETLIGSDRKDMPPNATVYFSPREPWNPSPSRHYCVVVRIDPYNTPSVPPVHEMTEANNWAQSNYDRFISKEGSPGTREITTVSVHNPFPRRTRFFIRAGQTNPLYRTYIENTWLVLEPDETRWVQVMFEWAPKAPQSDPNLNEGQLEEFFRVTNRVTLLGLIENPLDEQLHGPEPVSGAQVDVDHGYKTRFDKFEAYEHYASGSIVRTSDGTGVPGGQVILILRAKENREENYQTHDVRQDGTFAIEFYEEWQEIEAYYVPAPDYSDCQSELITR